MEDCIFCKIAAGTAPSQKVYEDDAVIAIMDISPWTKGHLLVVPKNHAANIWEISEVDAAAVTRATLRLAGALRTALSPDGLNLLQSNGHAAWQSVEHFHQHLIPRWFSDSLIPPAVASEGNPRTIAAVAQSIVDALE